jgi:ubiquinone/menaquinone biosynthesis C-methylase UbiE
MHDVNAVAELLRAYEPRLALGPLVEEVNKLYHAREADSYDARHIEILERLPVHWKQMIEIAVRNGPPSPWRILDFGCGTGFASEQLLANLPTDRIAELVCYDPSPEMLERCRSKLTSRFGRIRFVADFQEVLESAEEFQVLASNSVLHHLPDPFAVARQLERRLTSGSIWLAGHEPSCRFYQNPECMKLYRTYLKSEKRWQFFRPRKWLNRLTALLGKRPSPAKQAAHDAFRQGLFATLPSPRIISRLVDYHVPHGQQDLDQGFCMDLMLDNLQPRWQMLWQKTYAFMGREFEDRLPANWRRRCQALAESYPLDGANFCSVWKLSGNEHA